MNEVIVILESRAVLITTEPDQTGTFRFENLEDGEYFVKVQAEGYRATPARRVVVPLVENEEPYRLERITTEDYIFYWEEDQSTSGYEYSSHVNTPVTIEFHGQVIETVDTKDAGEMLTSFNVVLSNDGSAGRRNIVIDFMKCS